MKNVNIYRGLSFAFLLLLNLLTSAAGRAQVTNTSNPIPSVPAAAQPAVVPEKLEEGKLRLNFRGAPLEMVLNYLSEAAGYIIVLETEVKGKLDVWSNQPVTQEEALTILNSALSKNGYAALQNGRSLTIVSKETAKKRDIPVKSGNNPLNIPKTDEMVTQIIPVKFINAAQLTQNLQPLLPSEASMTANEAGNALVITDTQASIRRITEIIHALDTSGSEATTVHVFALQYADAKQVVTMIKELFPTQQDSQRGGGGGGGGGGRGGNPFAGVASLFGGGGGGGGGGRGDNSGTSAATRASNAKIVAAADEHSNSVAVRAPDDVMPAIEDLIRSVDTNVEDVTELRVFHLKHSDPAEMATMLAGLFPDESKSNDNNGRGQIRFGGGGFGGGGFGGQAGGQNGAGAGSDRAKKKGRVITMPDHRTASIVVSAARDLMPQISQMITQLDANPAKKQKVFVYDLENADPQQVQEVLKSLFESNQNQTRRTTGSSGQNSALTTRSTQSQNGNTRTGVSSGGGNNGGQGGGGNFGRNN